MKKVLVLLAAMALLVACGDNPKPAQAPAGSPPPGGAPTAAPTAPTGGGGGW